MANEIFPNSSRSPAVVQLGVPVTLTWAATATLGIAYREGKVTKPNGQVVNLARVWYPDGPLGPQAFTDTTVPGTYTWLSRYADMSILQGAANGLTAEYFNDTSLNPAQLVFVRTDPNIDYYFEANTPPSPGIVSDHYSMRWTGFVIPRFSGNYTFSTLSDDGVRLWVNNQQLINNWTDHGATTDVGPPIFLNANQQYPIRLEFFNNFGPGLIHLYWQSVNQNYEVVPQSQLRNTGTVPPTYGTGYKDQELTFVVGGLSQAGVTINPNAQTVQVGATINFTASGGSGTGLFNWGGQAGGVGTTKQVQFNSVGTFQVTVYRAGDNTYNQSNTAVATITVTKANQATLVASPANQTVAVGVTATVTANGGSGTGQYQWGGDVSALTSQNFLNVPVSVAGVINITVKKLGDSTYNDSNTATAKITGQKQNQAAVTATPTGTPQNPLRVAQGQSVTFTASGGSGTGLYQWGSEASGTGVTKEVTFNILGTRTVTVLRQADAAYNASSTFTITVLVQTRSITPNSSRSPATRPIGQAFTLTWAASATIGVAYREGVIVQPNGTEIGLARVNYFEPGMLGPQSYTPTGGKGVYTWRSRYADQSVNSGPPLTYGTGYIDQNLTFEVLGIAQAAVTLTPGPTVNITIGDSVEFTAAGGSGSGAYEWGGEASGGGTTKTIEFSVAGTFQVTVKKLGDSTYNDSNTALATVNVFKQAQSTVTISPASIDVEPGQTVEFTASGGDGTGDYQWGGEGSGTGSTKSIQFNDGGTKTVTVQKLGDSEYAPSNIASASVRVAVHIITPNSTKTPVNPQYGQAVSLKWNATATLGIYYREGTIEKPDGTIIPLARVYYNQAGMLGPQAFLDTAQRGRYYWTSRYADFSVINPPLTYGTGYIDQVVNIDVNGLSQSTLSISPTTLEVGAGGTAVFTASGGTGTGNYVWSVLYLATNITETFETSDPTFSLPNLAAGSIRVRVRKLGDFTYNESNQSGVAALTVNFNPQPTVSIIPNAITVERGNIVTFTALGGAGTGAFVWGGNATGTGETKNVQFNQVGTFQVTVRKAADSLYSQSNLAVSTIIVIDLIPPTASITATPSEGESPLDTTIAWSAQNALSVDVSGPGLASTATSGSQLITDLPPGIKTYTIKATNSGGTVTATAQVAVDLTPIEVSGFTVHFTDQTVLRADSWLWDFGDGSSTTTIRNPTHTYAELGLYLVTLTVTCDGRTDVRQKLIKIGCSPADPLPFVVVWDDLINEETYPPFDDPRYVGTDYTSPLGPAASRQSIPANPNWTMCPDVDYCDGPDTLDIPQTTRFDRRWKVAIKDGKISFNESGLPLIGAPSDMFPPSLSMANTNYVTMSFDSESAPYFAYQLGTNQVRVHFRLNGTPLRVQFAGETPRLFSEVIINPITELCDVVLYYVRDGKIYVRFQRDSFGVEYQLCEPTIYGEELAVLTKVDANRTEQRIYLYGKTIGGKRLLFRSGLYPAFPSVDPVVVDVDPEYADSTITFDGGSYGKIDTVEFSEQDITIDTIDHSRGADAVDHSVVLRDGAYYGDPERGDLNVVLLDGTHERIADRVGKNITFGDGTHERIGEISKLVETFTDGTYDRRAEHIIAQETLTSGFNGTIADHGTLQMTLVDGTEARIADRAIIVLDVGGTYAYGQERSTDRVSLDSVYYRSGSHSARHIETLDSVDHLSGTEYALWRETLSSVSHLNRTDKSQHRETLNTVFHRSGRTEYGKVVYTIKEGRYAQAEQHKAWMGDTFTGGEYAFGLLTFDNTDSDHFDSTKFTWDLNVSPDDPEIPP